MEGIERNPDGCFLEVLEEKTKDFYTKELSMLHKTIGDIAQAMKGNLSDPALMKWMNLSGTWKAESGSALVLLMHENGTISGSYFEHELGAGSIIGSNAFSGTWQLAGTMFILTLAATLQAECPDGGGHMYTSIAWNGVVRAKDLTMFDSDQLMMATDGTKGTERVMQRKTPIFHRVTEKPKRTIQ